MICGKVAAGKSTLAARLAKSPATILISEDHWTSRLFKDELKTVADYARYSRRLRDAMGPHVVTLLTAGFSVVLDFPANAPAQRKWMCGLFEEAGAAHRLHFLDASNEVCLERLHQRNAAGSHEFAVSDAEFEEITRYFVPPADAEGFEVTVYSAA
jgi:predicted kinase